MKVVHRVDKTPAGIVLQENGHEMDLLGFSGLRLCSSTNAKVENGDRGEAIIR